MSSNRENAGMHKRLALCFKSFIRGTDPFEKICKKTPFMPVMLILFVVMANGETYIQDI